MQRLSHSSRAYIVSQGALHGFLVEYELIAALRTKGNIKKSEKTIGKQTFDLDVLQKQLNDLPEAEKKEELLQEQYPAVYIFDLKAQNKLEQLNKYM